MTAAPSLPPASLEPRPSRGLGADAHPRAMFAPVLLSLPNGLDLGGVTTWAVRLADGLAQRGHRVVVVAHPLPPNHIPAQIQWRSDVEVVHPPLPSMHGAQGDLSAFIDFYRTIIADLRSGSDLPVVLSPNILGDAYGVAAALCLTSAPDVRVLAWQHTDSAYDTTLLRRYESIISKFVAIDDRYVRTLTELFPQRAGDITSIPHGIESPDELPRRERLPGRPVRLIYTGRIEHPQKRIGALASMSDALTTRGLAHELVIVGDGPAARDLDALVATRPSMRRIPSASASEVMAHLRWADAFVLPSRYEGLCISRIEAMALGCVPIVTQVNSGAIAGLADGMSAMFVDALPSDDETATGVSLADGVERLLKSNVNAMSESAWQSARDHFSLEAHIDRVSKLMSIAAQSPPRWWRASWAPAFSSGFTSPGASGSTGPEAAFRMRETLAKLSGRRVVIHGVGQHSIELAAELARSTAHIVAFTDDAPGTWGRAFFGWPVLPPTALAGTEATDVVISSYMHCDAIWARRSVYEAQGLAVHRLYPPSNPTGR